MVAFLFPVVAILAGLLAASNVVVQKLPDAKELIKKLEPYQAGLGIAALALGIVAVIDMKNVLGRGSSNLSYLMLILCAVSSVAIGFLQGFPLIQRYVLDEAEESTQEKVENIRKKVLPYQVLAGLAAMGTGVMLLLGLIF